MKKTTRNILYVIIGSVALIAVLMSIAPSVGGIIGGASAVAATEGDSKGDAKAKVVVVHGASWCGWSKKMMSEFGDAKKGLAAHGIEAEAVEDKSSKGKELSKEHSIDGYPTSIVYKDGKVVGKIGGYRKADDMVKEVKKLM